MCILQPVFWLHIKTSLRDKMLDVYLACFRSTSFLQSSIFADIFALCIVYCMDKWDLHDDFSVYSSVFFLLFCRGKAYSVFAVRWIKVILIGDWSRDKTYYYQWERPRTQWYRAAVYNSLHIVVLVLKKADKITVGNGVSRFIETQSKVRTL